jgi:hypothetical protein
MYAVTCLYARLASEITVTHKKAYMIGKWLGEKCFFFNGVLNDVITDQLVVNRIGGFWYGEFPLSFMSILIQY